MLIRSSEKRETWTNWRSHKHEDSKRIYIGWDAVIRQDRQRCRRNRVIRNTTASCEPPLSAHMGLSSEAVHYALALLFRDSGMRPPLLLRLRETSFYTRSMRKPTEMGHGGDSHTFWYVILFKRKREGSRLCSRIFMRERVKAFENAGVSPWRSASDATPLRQNLVAVMAEEKPSSSHFRIGHWIQEATAIPATTSQATQKRALQSLLT